MTTRYKDIDEAREAARVASLDGSYVILFNCFGLEVVAKKRLDTQAPCDSFTKTYWLNGKEKSFTNAQKVANDRAGHL